MKWRKLKIGYIVFCLVVAAANAWVHEWSDMFVCLGFANFAYIIVTLEQKLDATERLYRLYQRAYTTECLSHEADLEHVNERLKRLNEIRSGVREVRAGE